MPSDEQNQIGANNRRRRVLRKMLYLRDGVAFFATVFEAGALRLFFKAATQKCRRAFLHSAVALWVKHMEVLSDLLH